MTSDRGDIVLGWLTKLAMLLAVVGVLGFDLVSLGASRFQAEDHAQTAARAAAAAYTGPADLQKAYDAAYATVLEHGDTVEAPSFAVSPSGRITLTLHRTAPTLLVERIAALRGWAEVTRTVTSAP